MSDTTDSFGRDFRWWAMEAAKQEARAEKAEAKLAEQRDNQRFIEEQRDKWFAAAKAAEAELAGVEKGLTLICEFTQEHGDWSKDTAGGAAAHVHNIARAALEGRAE